MKKMYISPAIMVRGIENGAFLENPITDYSYTDIDPENDPETDQPVRSPRKSIWDDVEEQEEKDKF